MTMWPTRFVGGDSAALLHLVQLAAISLDPWFSRAQSPEERTSPRSISIRWEGAPFSRVRDVARWVRDELQLLGRHGQVKTSGASGLHIYLPMRPDTRFGVREALLSG